MAKHFPLEDDPLWYKDAVIYELHVRAFHDSSGDGMGDFRGLDPEARLLAGPRRHRYLAAAVLSRPRWKDDGYDIADYTDVHPAYGTLKDFQLFLREAHRRGLARHHGAGHQPHFRSASLVSACPPAPRRAASGATSTSGATRPRNTAKPASSSRISRPRTGPGIRSRRLITGIASIRISRI